MDYLSERGKEASLELKFKNVIESKVRRCIRSFNRVGNRSLPETECESGFRATGISILSDTRIGDLSEGGSWITYETKREEKLLETGVYMRIRFRSSGTVGYGPTLCVQRRKGSDILHGYDSKACHRIAYQLCWHQRWYQGRGTNRTIFLLVETRRTNRQSSRPSVVTGMSSTAVTGSY